MCAEQWIALKCNREQDSSNAAFLAFANALVTLGAVLMKHLEKGGKNAKMISWQIQNYVTECLSEFVRSKRKDEIPDYWAVIVDKVTGRFSDKEILLLCLR